MSTNAIKELSNKIQALKLQRIDVEKGSDIIDSNDPFDKMFVERIESERQKQLSSIDQKIALLEAERDTLAAKKTPPGEPKHLQVKKEVDRLRKLKKNQARKLSELFDDVAKQMNMTPSAVQRAYHYKAK